MGVRYRGKYMGIHRVYTPIFGESNANRKQRMTLTLGFFSGSHGLELRVEGVGSRVEG